MQLFCGEDRVLLRGESEARVKVCLCVCVRLWKIVYGAVMWRGESYMELLHGEDRVLLRENFETRVN